MKSETYKAGEITLVRVIAPYDQALEGLKGLNAREGTLVENAHARIQLGKDSELSRYGNWVKEDILYIPKKGAFLTKNPTISRSAKKATQSHREGKEFYPTKKQAEKALENAIQIPYTTKQIPTNRFNDEEITKFAFEGNAQEYGEFLKNAGIKEMPLWLTSEDYANEQSKPFARKLWFGILDGRSGLDGDGDLHYDFIRLFGVQKSGEAAQKISEPKIETYTPKQITQALKQLKLSGLEEKVISALRK